MSGKGCLLDTNILIGLFANEPYIIEKLQTTTQPLLVPSIVFGELFYGAFQSSKREFNLNRIEVLAQHSLIVDCDAITARFYGMIKSDLKLNGTPIPENDIWIASLAMQYELILVTRDRHFNNVKGLVLDGWL